MSVPKRLIKSLLRRQGWELCRLYDDEKTSVPGYARFSYREVQCFRALAHLGQISVGEGRLLGELVRSSDPERPIIEIGTLFGFSTTVLALFKAPSQRLITVDKYCWNPLGLSPEAHFALTRNRLDDLVRNHNVEVLRMDKDDFYQRYDGPPPALFFCDADHSYEATKADIEWARSVKASIICGDDYMAPGQDGVAEAVHELGGPRLVADALFVM